MDWSEFQLFKACSCQEVETQLVSAMNITHMLIWVFRHFRKRLKLFRRQRKIHKTSLNIRPHRQRKNRVKMRHFRCWPILAIDLAGDTLFKYLVQTKCCLATISNMFMFLNLFPSYPWDRAILVLVPRAKQTFSVGPRILTNFYCCQKCRRKKTSSVKYEYFVSISKPWWEHDLFLKVAPVFHSKKQLLLPNISSNSFFLTLKYLHTKVALRVTFGFAGILSWSVGFYTPIHTFALL